MPVVLVCIQIGNTDHKLTQQEWSAFVAEMDAIIESHQTARHFFGGPTTYARWQNVCWVVEVSTEDTPFVPFLSAMKSCRKKYGQDAVCLLTGVPSFV